GKDELFIAVVERRTAEDGQRVAAAIAKGRDTFSRLLAMARYFNVIAVTRPYHALLDMAAHLPEQNSQRVRGLIDERVTAPVRAVTADGTTTVLGPRGILARPRPRATGENPIRCYAESPLKSASVGLWQCMPPSTWNTCPVMKRDSSQARNTAVWPTSSG